ncbi:BID domain-containing T4SS effector, partial [Bartonella tribocorum]
QRQHQQAQQEKTIQPLSNHEIARKVQQDPSVKQSKREIQFLSEMVFGNPFILQHRIDDMQKAPEMGAELAYQIGNYSKSSGSLAGRKIFGIKTAARKAAEEHLPALCTAIRDYADTVQQLRDTIVQNHQIEQQQRSYHKQTLFPVAREILNGLHQDKIRSLCGKIFGDRLILEQSIQKIKENPNVGEQLLWNLTENPLSISELAGENVLGTKDRARKEAEEHLPALCTAIKDYVDNVNKMLHGLHQDKIRFLCHNVFGDRFILDQSLQKIKDNPEVGEQLLWDLTKKPLSISELADETVLGTKNRARKEAEEHLPALCTAIRDYADKVKQLRDTIVQNYQTEQQQRHQPLTDLDRKLQKQQSLWQSPKIPEQSTKNHHREISETSKQEEQLLTRSHRAKTSKAMALS